MASRRTWRMDSRSLLLSRAREQRAEPQQVRPRVEMVVLVMVSVRREAMAEGKCIVM